MDIIAHESILELYAGQSRTLEQASARYTLKSGQAPPPNYDKWFAFAQENHCLIDEYDRIHRDFAPFYQLARDYPEHFQAMVDSGREMVIVYLNIMLCSAHLLPDMEFFVNGRDEPRVVFNALAPSAQEEAMQLKDLEPFRIAPVPTSEFFRKQSGCDVSHNHGGFASDPINDIAFLRSSSSSGFTTDLWPLLSMAKISPCFSDILFPGPYYYDQSIWSGTFMHPDDIAWEDKEPKLYWRGTANGGHIYGENYRSFPRFRLVDLARNHSDIIDARMTAFVDSHCTDDCDRDTIVTEYAIEGPVAPKEEIYQFKYLLDVDGNTFSGRYLGLLRSGSLVFKSTAFEEYFSDWLHPYEHYIPVRPDLSDLVAKVNWAIENEAEARAIQERGMQFATRVLTDRQNDCYFAAVLLEWSRLQSLALRGIATINRTTMTNATKTTGGLD
ncbi:glycosyl transferase family 90-domain-containing protein [Mycena galericulata]|nr:glycosyl transferase family 90-domain-containing protein [Mycena galericulata]